ncbi:unnamed protein product, partial [Didymodactylos carnosus]
APGCQYGSLVERCQQREAEFVELVKDYEQKSDELKTILVRLSLTNTQSPKHKKKPLTARLSAAKAVMSAGCRWPKRP